MRPNRNRMSRLVAAEMRYFHRPLVFSLLSCFTVTIVILSVLFSLLNDASFNVGNERFFLNCSIALLILFVASYLIYRIMRRGRSVSYGLVMSFSSIYFLFSAAASFLLTRAAWQASLESAMVDGYQIYIQNILRWTFWAPGAVLLLYFIRVFIKAKTPNRAGGWWFLLLPLTPALIVGLLALAMQFAIEKEDAVPITSIAMSVYLSLMLVLAVRYAVKAILNSILRHTRAAEETVLVRNMLRQRDGKWIQWWEKKPAPIELAADQTLLPEPEVPAGTLASEPVSESVPIAAIEQIKQPPKVKKTKPPKESKPRPPKPAPKPRLSLRELIALTLAALQRPALPAPMMPFDMMGEPVVTEVSDEMTAVQEAEETAGIEITADVSAALDESAPDSEPRKTLLPPKLVFWLNRAAAYLKKPYSPPVETEVKINKKSVKKGEELSRLTRLLNMVAAQKRRAQEVDAVASEETPPSKTSAASKNRGRPKKNK